MNAHCRNLPKKSPGNVNNSPEFLPPQIENPQGQQIATLPDLTNYTQAQQNNTVYPLVNYTEQGELQTIPTQTAPNTTYPPVVNPQTSTNTTYPTVVNPQPDQNTYVNPLVNSTDPQNNTFTPYTNTSQTQQTYINQPEPSRDQQISTLSNGINKDKKPTDWSCKVAFDGSGDYQLRYVNLPGKPVVNLDMKLNNAEDSTRFIYHPTWDLLCVWSKFIPDTIRNDIAANDGFVLNDKYNEMNQIVTKGSGEHLIGGDIDIQNGVLNAISTKDIVAGNDYSGKWDRFIDSQINNYLHEQDKKKDIGGPADQQGVLVYRFPKKYGTEPLVIITQKKEASKKRLSAGKK